MRGMNRDVVLLIHARVFVRLPQDDIRLCGILRGDLVVDQHAIIAPVGDEQACPVRQSKTRRIHGLAANGWVESSSTRVGAGGAQPSHIVRDSADKVQLP